jgi:hypothetical protein
MDGVVGVRRGNQGFHQPVTLLRESVSIAGTKSPGGILVPSHPKDPTVHRFHCMHGGPVDGQRSTSYHKVKYNILGWD